MSDEKTQEQKSAAEERRLNSMEVNQLVRNRLPFKPSVAQISQAISDAPGPTTQNGLLGKLLLAIHEQLTLINQGLRALREAPPASTGSRPGKGK